MLFTKTAYNQLDTLKVVVKPRVGVGTGFLTYFGEIQSYQSGFSATNSRVGGNLMLNAPLSNAFNIEFAAIYGKVSSNERTLVRNYNFESRIRMASISLQYNFYPFFKPTRSFIHPYLGIGFSSFEFLSKSDLYDSNGSKYYYWNDGSIMDKPQSNPLNAKPLFRDYHYETDLREQNLDSLGKYREQSFAIPLSLGFEFHLSERIDFRIGTTLNYTFTDLIDNISESGTGIRKGDSKNDFLVYSNIGLSYDLEKFLPKKEEDVFMDSTDHIAILEYDQVDADNDGVIDAIDDCAATPLEALVDLRGCPLDTDKDGVPDYFDEENTPIDNHVNWHGVTISDEEFLKMQEIMMDSTGLAFGWTDEYHRKSFSKEKDRKRNAKDIESENKNYVVILGKEHKNISANELHKYLGYTEFETIQKGDTVYYVLGNFDKIEDAVAAKTSLENAGIEVEEIGKNNNAKTDFISIDEKVIEKVEKINIQEGKELPEINNNEVTYRVQIGTFKTLIDIDKSFPGIENVTFVKGSDGLVRYYAGVYDNYSDAKKGSSELSKKGITDKLIVAYKDQERITLKEAGILLLPKNYNEEAEKETFIEPRKKDTTTTQDNRPKIDMKEVKYFVLLGSFNDNLPVDLIDIYFQIGVKPVKEKDGSTKYYSKSTSTLEEANALLKSYEDYQLDGAEVRVLYKGKYYSVEEFEKKRR